MSEHEYNLLSSDNCTGAKFALKHKCSEAEKCADCKYWGDKNCCDVLRILGYNHPDKTKPKADEAAPLSAGKPGADIAFFNENHNKTSQDSAKFVINTSDHNIFAHKINTCLLNFRWRTL